MVKGRYCTMTDVNEMQRERERTENETSRLGGVASTASVNFLNNKVFFLSLQVSVLLEKKVFV